MKLILKSGSGRLRGKVTPLPHSWNTTQVVGNGSVYVNTEDLVEDRHLPLHFVVVHQIVGCIKPKPGKVGTGIPTVCYKVP